MGFDFLKRYTLEEMAPVLGDLHSLLPGWRKRSRERFYREDGPVVQFVTLERLSTRAFRIASGLRVLVVPKSYNGWSNDYLQCLAQKGISNSEVSYNLANYLSKREEIKAEVMYQMKPALDKPLEVQAVFDWYETLRYPKIPHAHASASFAAYLGDEQKAIHWIEHFRMLCAKEPANIANSDWVVFDKQHLDRLEGWIKQGTAHEELERLIPIQREMMGIRTKRPPSSNIAGDV
jgi:hypothetical protein